MAAASQATVKYAWDNADRLTGITQGTTSVGFSYDTSDRRTKLTLPNGMILAYTYDADSRSDLESRGSNIRFSSPVCADGMTDVRRPSRRTRSNARPRRSGDSGAASHGVSLKNSTSTTR